MGKAEIRKASFADEAAVQALCQRNGLKGEACENAWEWIWKRNECYTSDWPLGWVLESQGKVVGFIGNIPRRYLFGGSEWIAGVARSFVVDEVFRGRSTKLLWQFVSQKGADLIILSSANQNAALVYEFVGAEQLPQADYDKDLIWPVSPIGFLASVLPKYRVRGIFTYPPTGFFSSFVHLFFSRLRPRDETIQIEKMEIKNIGAEFDQFFSYVVDKHPDRLLSGRSATELKWQFENSSALSRKPILFAAKQNGNLCGYAITTRADSVRFGLKRRMVIDLIVKDDDSVVIRELIVEALVFSKREQVDLLQITGFPCFVRSPLWSLRPVTRLVPHWAFWYLAINSRLKEQLRSPDAWYASTFDGDSAI